jgi:hypothetical protein
MRGADQSWQTIVGVNIDCDHEVESQQRQVSKVVLRQSLASQVRVHATKTTKTIDRDANTFEIGKLNASIVTDHHVFNMAAAIDEGSDLPACFVRKFGELAGKLRCQNLMWSYPPCVKLFNAAKLIGLETRSVSDYVLDSSFPPSTWACNACAETNSAGPQAMRDFFGLKLQDE